MDSVGGVIKIGRHRLVGTFSDPEQAASLMRDAAKLIQTFLAGEEAGPIVFHSLSERISARQLRGMLEFRARVISGAEQTKIEGHYNGAVEREWIDAVLGVLRENEGKDIRITVEVGR